MSTMDMVIESSTRYPIPINRNDLNPIFYPTHPMVFKEIASEMRTVRSISPRNWEVKRNG